MYCWGNNSRGNLGDGTTASSLVATVVKGIPGPVQSVQASITNANPTGGGWSGGGFTCAVSDSKGYCWGDNAAGKAGQRGGQAYLTQATQIDTSGSPLDGKVITQIAPGGAHACALAEGQVYCWGANNNKQLSNNDMGSSSTVPVLVGDGLAGKQVTAIASGTYHTCAIADGDLYCWGDWGGGKTVAQIIAAGGKKFSQLTAGHYSSCAMTNGSPYCWGQDNFGVFGNGPSGGSASPVPTDMSNMNGQFFNRVITSYYTSCGLTNTMKVYCWGADNNGWLGDGNPPSSVKNAVVYDKPTNPVVQDDRTTMKSAVLTFADTNTILTSGQHHACRLANGDVYCWGKNNYGQLGDGTNIDRRHLMRVTTAGTPMEGKAATSITSTENFTCAIADAKLFCWGDNGSGQFGNGSTASSSTPKAAATSLPADALITQASAGDSHVCAVVARTTSPSASEIYCWGNNSDGQLGNGSTGGYVTTAQKVTGIPAGAFVSKVAAKINHTCAIINGSASCWGNNMFSLTFFGKLGGGNGATTMYSTPQPVADITNVTDIALGNDHTCAIASSKAYCWGGDFYQQLGDGWVQWPRDKPYAVSMPATATPVTSIVAGDDNTCAIAASKVYCWGRNNSGQIGNGSTGANIDTPLLIPNTGGATQITAGLIHTCATINALVSCWGDNSLGQVGDNTTINRLSPTSSINTIYMVDKSYRY